MGADYSKNNLLSKPIKSFEVSEFEGKYMSDSRTKKIQKSDFIPNHYIITSDKDFILDDGKTLKAFQAQRKQKKIEKKIEEKENQNLNVI
jgi:hypothetical protein